eukprot:gene1466-4625_t
MYQPKAQDLQHLTFLAKHLGCTIQSPLHRYHILSMKKYHNKQANKEHLHLPTQITAMISMRGSRSLGTKSETTILKEQTVSKFPGLLACAATMQAGFSLADLGGQTLLELQGLHDMANSPISGIPVTIVLGMMVRNNPFWSYLSNLSSGIAFCKDKALKAGIICIGAKLSFLEVAVLGATCIPSAIVSVCTGLLIIPRIAQLLGLSKNLGALIATGTSVCGITAVSALAPALRASQNEVAIAVANVVAFGTLNMLVMPHLAHVTFSSSEQAGLFLGLSVHDTAQVMGAALTYQQLFADDVAFQSATVTKLTRNMLLIGVLPYMTWAHGNNNIKCTTSPATQLDDAVNNSKNKISNRASKLAANIKTYIPSFVFGFVAMSLARSLGDFSISSHGAAFGLLEPLQWHQLVSGVGGFLGTKVLLGTAMAAIGMSTSFAGMTRIGWQPFAVGFCGAALMSTTAVCCTVGIPALIQFCSNH